MLMSQSKPPPPPQKKFLLRGKSTERGRSSLGCFARPAAWLFSAQQQGRMQQKHFAENPSLAHSDFLSLVSEHLKLHRNSSARGGDWNPTSDQRQPWKKHLLSDGPHTGVLKPGDHSEIGIPQDGLVLLGQFDLCVRGWFCLPTFNSGGPELLCSRLPQAQARIWYFGLGTKSWLH